MGWSRFRRVGLTHHDPLLSFKGYTLIAPLGGDSAHLLDMQGAIACSWRLPGFRLSTVRLLDGGRLMALAGDAAIKPPEHEPGRRPPPPPGIFRLIGGGATDLVEIASDGSVAWSYHNEAIHHDWTLVDGEHLVIPEFVEVPGEVAKRVRGGVRMKGERLPPLISDDLVEIDRDGRDVARTHLWELLDPVRDPIGPNERRWEWTHTNSLDTTDDGDLLFSCRQNSRVGRIRRQSGELDWKYGAPETYHQHDASALPGGNVLIFDNGMNRPQALPYSRVIEVDPVKNEIVWNYTANPPQQFFSGHISGAQRLPNGNTLICEGASGRVFEVTPAGEVAWEWISPVTHVVDGQRRSWLFRAYRYGPGAEELAGLKPDRDRYSELNRLYGLAV